MDKLVTNENVYIVADIGGTNARFAFVTSQSYQLQGIENFTCADFPCLIDACRKYMAQRQLKNVAHFCMAVAAVVESDWIDLVNNHWAFSHAGLEKKLAAPVKIINDFTAQVLSTNVLADDELRWFGSARPTSGGVKAVVGPGTGLGVGVMISSGEVVPSEAGHIAFAPSNEHEIKLLTVLWQRYKRVSVERLLSGGGLCNLYWANAQLQGLEEELDAPQITAGALAGDSLCLKTIEDFYAILGSVAGDVSLMMGASGGVYISGGIVPRILPLLEVESFRARFEDKGRYRDFCSQVPIAVVLAEQPGLQGCVEALNFHCL
ncbi:MAG: glucokinase [Spongiibacteraceae bacterium]|nr:glucokinase [Spongiibacteraceae bacterium]